MISWYSPDKVRASAKELKDRTWGNAIASALIIGTSFFFICTAVAVCSGCV